MDGRLSMERSSKTNLQVICIGILPKCETNLFSFSFPCDNRESNCFMVPSKAEAKNVERNQNRQEPVKVTESDENETVAFANGHTNGQTTTNGTTNGTSTTNGSNPNESQNKPNEETNK